MTKAQVSYVLGVLVDVVKEELNAGRPIKIPNLVQISLAEKPATAARPGRNPFTGEAIMIKAKPARRVVKVRALSALKKSF
jgi:nucleoid DNA-binding protein